MFEALNPDALVGEIETSVAQESVLMARRCAAIAALLEWRTDEAIEVDDGAGMALITGFARTTAEVSAAMNMSPMAAQHLVGAQRRARMTAILESREIVLTIAPDSLVIRVGHGGLESWRASGPAAEGVALAGGVKRIVYSPVGITTGLSNASFPLTRGNARRTVVVSRLGRARILP